MLDHVLRENGVEGRVGERKAPAHVEMHELVAAPVVVEVGVQPTCENVPACAEVQLANLVRLQVAADFAAAP